MANRWIAILTASALTVAAAPAQMKSETKSTPSELGRIPFQRDYAEALAKAKADKKPLFVLFDEVPGCETCKLFGAGPLSHPSVVAAASAEFVPVAVYNNVTGKDSDLLKKFREPAWNNPVVRFLDAGEKDLIDRKDEVYQGGVLLERMVAALEKAKRPVPTYLKEAAAEYGAKKSQTAVFAMYCYWEGEAKLGGLEGVLATRIGELDRKEVVEVTFDPERLSFQTLVEKAIRFDCTHKVFARTEEHLKIAKRLVAEKAALSKDEIDAKTQQQYHLFHYPRYYFLPLTSAQASKANAMIAEKLSPDGLLSPLQLELVERLKKATESQLKELGKLKPDRTPTGVIGYWAKLEEALAKK